MLAIHRKHSVFWPGTPAELARAEKKIGPEGVKVRQVFHPVHFGHIIKNRLQQRIQANTPVEFIYQQTNIGVT